MFYLPLLCSLPLTFNGPWRDDVQSISNLLFFEDPSQCTRTLETMDALTIIAAVTVQLVLSLADLVLEPLHGIHRPMESQHLCEQRLVSDMFQRIIHLVSPCIIAAEVAQLLVGVIRDAVTAVMRGCGVYVTLVNRPPLYMHPITVGLTPIRTIMNFASATPRPLLVGMRKGT
jgi:hypothetical protein